MKKISIIIPRHDEPATPYTNEEIKANHKLTEKATMHMLLTSLETQIGVNWDDYEILIVNDIEGNIITDFSMYPKIAPHIRNLKNFQFPGMMGYSRQIGIDNSQAEYCIFCDADDMLYSCSVLADYTIRINVAQNDKSQEFDILITNFIEEGMTFDTKQLFYSPHTKDYTWMFAKLYRVDFIKKNNIRNSNHLHWHEDSFFHVIHRAYSPRIMFNEWPSYVWKFNPKSITRQNDAEYSFNSLTVFIQAIEEGIDEVLRRNIADVTENVIQLMCYIYYLLQTNIWKTERALQYKHSVEMRLAQFMFKYKDLLENAPAEKLLAYLNQEYQSQVQKTGPFLIEETWTMFSNRITKQYQDEQAVEKDEETAPMNFNPAMLESFVGDLKDAEVLEKKKEETKPEKLLDPCLAQFLKPSVGEIPKV